MKPNNALDLVLTLLLIIGGINWGLVGLLNLDLVATLFGSDTFTTNLVYILVGVSGIYLLFRTLSARSV